MLPHTEGGEVLQIVVIAPLPRLPHMRLADSLVFYHCIFEFMSNKYDGDDDNDDDDAFSLHAGLNTEKLGC